jgi:hypothetical protein
MQDLEEKQKSKIGFKINELPLEDQQRLVGAFVWLIEEDRKQNPASELYKLKKTKNYD